MHIAIIGTGYVGLVTGACFAELGNTVYCVDSDKAKVQSLKKGIIPIYEPGLEKIVKKNLRSKRLSFSNEIGPAVKRSEVIFICVATPSKDNGEPDLLALESVSRDIARAMDAYKLIVEKSTVPVETGQWVKRTISTFNSKGKGSKRIEFDVASNPEFLREGSAIEDFMKPDRIVIGVESEKAKNILKALYKPIKAPVIATDIKSAEIIKHASNSYLAMKISFINAISIICEKSGADIKEVARGIGLDKRIGTHFLEAGVGFGGSCFPKDLAGFIYIAEKLGYKFNLLREVSGINEEQKRIIVEKISKCIWNIPGKTIGILGLSFKPNTDDIRNSPAIDIIRMLLGQGAKIRAYDPQAMQKTKEVLKKDITLCKDPYETAKGCDCLVVMTDWDEFKSMDFKRLKGLLSQAALVDGRNIYDPLKMKKIGFTYSGIGRRGAS